MKQISDEVFAQVQEALRPFAEDAKYIHKDWSDERMRASLTQNTPLTVRHFRKASEALAALDTAQPERAPLSCTWTQEDDFDTPGVYHTSCGEMWSFTEGGIKENNTKFCPHCGGGIKQGG